MKIFSILFSIIAIGLITYNATKIDFNTPFEGESIIALITITAAVCAVFLVWILVFSKRIERQSKYKK